jgi:hypothetical protein
MRQQWWEPWAEGGCRPAQREEVEVDEARVALEEEVESVTATAVKSISPTAALSHASAIAARASRALAPSSPHVPSAAWAKGLAQRPTLKEGVGRQQSSDSAVYGSGTRVQWSSGRDSHTPLKIPHPLGRPRKNPLLEGMVPQHALMSACPHRGRSRLSRTTAGTRSQSRDRPSDPLLRGRPHGLNPLLGRPRECGRGHRDPNLRPRWRWRLFGRSPLFGVIK